MSSQRWRVEFFATNPPKRVSIIDTEADVGLKVVASVEGDDMVMARFLVARLNIGDALLAENEKLRAELRSAQYYEDKESS
jgi:hypothetical protein